MFDAPPDAWYIWVSVALASVAVAGVATELPSRPAPDAAAAADTVDAVAGSTYASAGEHPLDADRVRLRPHRLALRTDGETSHATFAFGPVVPVGDDPALARVARGVPPGRAFGSVTAFEAAIEAARERASDAGWRPVTDRLVVRHLEWGEVDVTLVDA
ncbi:DUF7283 family protein [Haloarchaeobius iranensis]|uniref:Uncharacterized protein n=1 Tax=Haloarchaeobius iranensis TaxID=996166 RepID=A0A1G9TAT9_9EURY|nr:hypothetical protein [Haloarchaeobius iranensis]SDM44245.1 hypothetical protein SAMN05192554_102215 [Haloarchaeobius iranensis]